MAGVNTLRRFSCSCGQFRATPCAGNSPSTTRSAARRPTSAGCRPAACRSRPAVRGTAASGSRPSAPWS